MNEAATQEMEKQFGYGTDSGPAGSRVRAQHPRRAGRKFKRQPELRQRGALFGWPLPFSRQAAMWSSLGRWMMNRCPLAQRRLTTPDLVVVSVLPESTYINLSSPHTGQIRGRSSPRLSTGHAPILAK